MAKRKKSKIITMVDIENLREKWERIEADLKKELDARKLHQAFYQSLLSDYVALWRIKEILIRDIEQRGAVVEYDNGGGQKGTRKNDSVSELVKISAQMLKILSELGLRGADVKLEEPEEEL